MENETKKKLLKYARAPLWYLILGVCTALFGCGLGICMGINTRDIFPVLLWTIGLGGFGLYNVGRYIVSDIRLRRKISGIEKKGEARVLENDFKNAAQAFSGSIILGDRFIIAKDSGNILAYSELQRIQTMSESNLGMNNYVIYVRTPDSSRLRLCTVDRRMISNGEKESVYNWLLSKNRDLKPGQII